MIYAGCPLHRHLCGILKISHKCIATVQHIVKCSCTENFVQLETINRVQEAEQNQWPSQTFAILGFSNGGWPRGPSTDGWFMFAIHLRKCCTEQIHTSDKKLLIRPL